MLLWSLVKIVIFVILAIALAYGAVWILESPGGMTIAFGGREFVLSPIQALIGLLALMALTYLLIKLVGLLVATIRFLLGDETAVKRYFGRARERRGLNALSETVVALAEGDPKTASKKAQKADRLLDRPELTRLVSAQAAELSGDTRRARSYYKALLPDDKTRPAAIAGLMRQELEAGNSDTALELAKRAFPLRPDNPKLLNTLFDLQSQKQDWAGARSTMNAMMHARLLPRDVGGRRDAVLSLADAQAAFEAGNDARGNDAALQANKLAPTLVPAAALAAKVQTDKGAPRRATRILTTAWAANPHPDLAGAFAAIQPDETPDERRKRFETLTAAAPGDSESRMLATELALAAEDFPAARKALGDLAETEPTARSLSLMAAIERGQGAPDAVVRGWLAKALDASRGPQWTCGKCNHVHSTWMAVCDNCGAFDTLAWRTPPEADRSDGDTSGMLPLLVGSEDDATTSSFGETPSFAAGANGPSETVHDVHQGGDDPRESEMAAATANSRA